MTRPGSEKYWRTDGIEATYVFADDLRPNERVSGWRLGSTYAVEVNNLADIVAWCEFVPRKSKASVLMLATFHLYEHSPRDGVFRVWRILDRGPDGVVLTEPVPRDRVRLYVDISEHLGRGENASPVLRALSAAVAARAEARDAETLRQRSADPLIGIQKEVADILWQYSELEDRDAGRRELHSLFDRLQRESLTELAIRIAYSYYESADELYSLQTRLEERDDD